MIKRLVFSGIVITSVALLWTACRPPASEEIPIPTKICIHTQHHFQPIPNATVYIKYNTTVFPGYDKPASFYDASFSTGSNDHGCIESVPEGTHWLVSFGYDSLYYPHQVKGSLPVKVSLSGHATVDTVLYISE
jgi:hypothetical protein